MSHDHAHNAMPRSALIICWSAVILSIIAAGVGRYTGVADSRPTAPMVVSRDLVFQDRQDGGVAVFDTRDTAKPLEVVEPGTGYFLRALMRGLARQRIREDASHDVPFRLTQWADGRLTLEDPTTGRRVDMEAFGQDNEKVFANLLGAKLGS
jgi:putative photosynthetic complex assembly protein